MISDIERLLIERNLVDRSEKIRFLKMPSKSNKNSFIPLLIFFGKNDVPSFVAKIFKNPNNAALFDYLIHKHLKIKSKFEGSNLLDALPETFVYDCQNMFYVESYCKGKNLVPIFSKAVKLQSDAFRKVLATIVHWLYAFHKHTLSGELSASDLCSHFSQNDLEALHPLVGSKYSTIVSFLDRVSGYHKAIPLTYCHGDFNAYNIKIDSGKVRVYDWEDLYESEVPLLDLFHLFTVPIVSKKLISGDYRRNFVKYICCTSPFRAFFSKVLMDYCERFHISKEFANWYYLAYLLKMCLKERNDFRYDDSRELVWAHIAIEYIEIAEGKLLF